MGTCPTHRGCPMRLCSWCNSWYCDDHEAEHGHTPQSCMTKVNQQLQFMEALLEYQRKRWSDCASFYARIPVFHELG